MDSLTIVLILVAGLGTIILIRRIIRMYRHSQRINDYFRWAFAAYALLNDGDAGEAAIAAAKVAARNQRESMMAYVSGMTRDCLENPDPELGLVIRRMSRIQREISAKDWTLEDIRNEKERLNRCNPEYLTALNNADPTIFMRKYPHLLDRL